jgi:VanZ family protein
MLSDPLRIGARAALLAAACACVWGAVFAPQGIEHAFVPWDKAAHFIAIYGLTILLFAAFPNRRRLDLMLLAIFGGAAVELAQLMVGRDAELGDTLADAAGALAVMAPIWLERLRAPPRRERRRRVSERFPQGVAAPLPSPEA